MPLAVAPRPVRDKPSFFIAYWLRWGVILVGLALTTVVFFQPVRTFIPTGTDASVYINDVRWTLVHHHLPKPNQIITHGYAAYPSPGTDLVLSMLVRLTGGSIITIFSFYQLALILLLSITTCLVGILYRPRFSGWLIVSLIGSYALGWLYIASTVSNLIAFSLVNLIFYYTVTLVRAQRKVWYGMLIFILFVLLYLFHGYLTAPIFISTYVLYLIILALTRPSFRSQVRSYYQQTSHWLFIVVAAIIIGFCSFLIFRYWFIGIEAIRAFATPSTTDKYQYVVTWGQLGKIFGQPLWSLALIGIISFVFTNKKNLITWRVLPLLWLLVLWLLLQTYHLGLHFYFARIAYLGAIFVPFFAVYAITYRQGSKYITPLIASLYVCLTVITGSQYLNNLFHNSNFLGPNQLRALRLLATKVSSTNLVLSNVNGVEQTHHDVIITDANFRYYPSIQKKCPLDDHVCESFAMPDNNQAVDMLRGASVSYILLLKPNNESDVSLDILAQKYIKNSNIQTDYKSNEAYLFHIKDRGY